MSVFSWEDPFGYGGVRSKPQIYRPGDQTPPINYNFIHAQQESLAPIINTAKRAAQDVIRRVVLNPKLGGEVLLKKTEVTFDLSVLYRLPEAPNVIQKGFGPIPITDHAVVISADRNDIPSVIAEGLFIAQYLPEMENAERKPLIAQLQKEIGLIEQIVLRDNTTTRHVMVVYPRLLEFFYHWIKSIDGVIHAINPESDPGRPQERGGTTEFNGPAPLLH